jgi:dephospho-CoA kinase
MHKITAIIGEHASGKTTLAHFLANRFTKIISLTNRQLSDNKTISILKEEQIDCLLLSEGTEVSLDILSNRIKNDDLPKDCLVIIVSNVLIEELILKKFKEIKVQFVAIIKCYSNI